MDPPAVSLKSSRVEPEKIRTFVDLQLVGETDADDLEDIGVVNRVGSSHIQFNEYLSITHAHECLAHNRGK